MLHLKDQDASGSGCGDIDDVSLFCDLLDDIAPDPNCLVMLFKSYFDESYDNNLLCVAGYVFTSRNARKLDIEWKKMLALKRLPYFRMSACNTRQPPFDNLSESECIDIASKAINLICEYAMLGYAVTVDNRSFYEIVTSNGFVSSAYEFCAWMCLVGSNLKIEEIAFNERKSAFVFESGCRHQGVANKMMERIFSSPSLREEAQFWEL